MSKILDADFFPRVSHSGSKWLALKWTIWGGDLKNLSIPRTCLAAVEIEPIHGFELPPKLNMLDKN